LLSPILTSRKITCLPPSVSIGSVQASGSTVVLLLFWSSAINVRPLSWRSSRLFRPHAAKNPANHWCHHCFRGACACAGLAIMLCQYRYARPLSPDRRRAAI
jgi:hypothetical protein